MKGEQLTELVLEGFKSFRDRTPLRIAPLTVLAGANSSGKSSVLQPLLLMKQTLESPTDPGSTLLDGPLLQVERGADLAWTGRTKKDRAKTWSIEVRTTDRHVKNVYAATPGAPLLETQELTHGVVFSENLTEETRARLRDQGGPFMVPSQTTDADLVPVQVRCVFGPGRIWKPINVVFPLPTDFWFPHVLIQDLLHLPGLRGRPERRYPIRGVDRFAGPFPDYVAGLLLRWKQQKSPVSKAVAEDLRDLGITWAVDVQDVSETSASVVVGRLPKPKQGGAKDLVSIADVGLGASQVLPVVVALHAARPGQVVHIEQPELHLHPRAQRALAGVLLRAAERGATVIVETHSSLLVRAIQTTVAKEKLPPKDFALHWFERGDDGATKVTTADLRADGTYGDWPVDFDEVERQAEIDFLDASFGGG